MFSGRIDNPPMSYMYLISLLLMLTIGIMQETPGVGRSQQGSGALYWKILYFRKQRCRLTSLPKTLPKLWSSQSMHVHKLAASSIRCKAHWYCEAWSHLLVLVACATCAWHNLYNTLNVVHDVITDAKLIYQEICFSFVFVILLQLSTWLIKFHSRAGSFLQPHVILVWKLIEFKMHCNVGGSCLHSSVLLSWDRQAWWWEADECPHMQGPQRSE